VEEPVASWDVLERLSVAAGEGEGGPSFCAQTCNELTLKKTRSSHRAVTRPGNTALITDTSLTSLKNGKTGCRGCIASAIQVLEWADYVIENAGEK
jgi:hypothetical protein